MITKSSIKNPEILAWLDSVEAYLDEKWGLNADFAIKLSMLLLYSSFFGNSWDVISGFRDPEKQKNMRARWDAGDRSGLAYRPALTSKHSETSWIGKSDAIAADVKFSDQNYAGFLAKYFGLKWGGNFKRPDPNHFYI